MNRRDADSWIPCGEPRMSERASKWKQAVGSARPLLLVSLSRLIHALTLRSVRLNSPRWLPASFLHDSPEQTVSVHGGKQTLACQTDCENQAARRQLDSNRRLERVRPMTDILEPNQCRQAARYVLDLIFAVRRLPFIVNIKTSDM